MIPHLAKTIVVVVSSTILATLATNAIDMRGQFASTFLGTLFFGVESKTVELCPDNMVLVDQTLVPFCVDIYEAAASESCMYKEPSSAEETLLNMANTSCVPVVRVHAQPWTHVTRMDAEELCSRVGKRLPQTGEWYVAARGTPDQKRDYTEEQCNVARNRIDSGMQTGAGMRCVSDVGAYDMVGNVWEWVQGDVTHGVWFDRTVPPSGFVTEVDMSGMTTQTETAHDVRFNGDRFWSDSTIVAGIMRGGYYDSNSNAGVYATYAASPPHFTGDAVGFRCVADVTMIEK